MRAVLGGLMALLLAGGSLLEMAHHHGIDDDAPASCCGHSCVQHHADAGAPELGAPEGLRRWAAVAPDRLPKAVFAEPLFRPPAA